ncbi:MAG: Gp49 family protein [Methylibium sp.]
MHVQSPDTTDPAIEREIQAKGLEAPRIRPADIEACIISEHYFTAEDGYRGAALNRVQANGGVIDAESAKPPPSPLYLLTFCVLVLRNGFTVTGESAVASPENFDADIGRKVARQNAVQKIWPLEGYLLRQRLFENCVDAQGNVYRRLLAARGATDV